MKAFGRAPTPMAGTVTPITQLSGGGGNAGAKIGTAAHNTAHAGFRSKLTPAKTDRGSFQFKNNRSADRT